MITLGVGCQIALHPTLHPGYRFGCGADFLPYTQIWREWVLKIRHLQALGVGGVEGAAEKIFGLLLRARVTIHT